METFGCQMNVLDSELVLSQLRAHGYQSVEDRDLADVILYNTCSVREHAEQKVWSRLGELRQRKKDQPGLVLGVIGCMAEREGKSIFQKFPHVDILCGPGELDKLASMVHNACTTSGHNGDPHSDLTDGAGGTHDHAFPSLNPSARRQVALMGSTVRRSSTLAAAEDHLENLDLSRSISASDDVAQAYVRITRGCNKFCTYCVVPYTRGPEVHRPPQNIIDEVKMLNDAGAKEVTLLGQTINHYKHVGTDGRITTFAELLYQSHEATPNLPRLRFVTSFPRDFGDDALQAMRDCPRICRYLHVPAQHGSNRILKLMNRGYTVEQYKDFFGRAKEMMPDLSVASDFIVGFPTETDEEFEQTCELIRYCRFKNSFIFKYSPRPGTTAIERFEDDVPDDVKKVRNNALLAVQQQICLENNQSMIGKTLEVMIEGMSKHASAAVVENGVELGANLKRRARIGGGETVVQLTGRTRGDLVVAFEGIASMKGEILDVEIVDAKGMTLFGRIARPVIA